MRLVMHDAQHMDGVALDNMQMHGTGTSLGDPIEIGATVGRCRLTPNSPRLVPGCPLAGPRWTHPQVEPRLTQD